MRQKFITIYTDASFHPTTGLSRWAFYARCDEGKLVQDGETHRRLKDSNEAEMYAICRAIWECFRKWPHLRGFFVNTDSLHCCRVWWPYWEDPTGKGCSEMRDKITAKLQGRWVRVKHVRAHQKNIGVRSYLNNLVDRLASRRGTS